MTFPTWPTRTRDERGAVLPSPVVLLSIVAVALAAIAFVATRGDQPVERDISATKAAATPTAKATDEPADAGADAGTDPAAPPTGQEKPAPPPVVRGEHAVVVFNNTAIRGLAGRVSEKVKAAGWKVAAADNWYGTVPATTVYFPKGKKAPAQLLALDLGIARVLPADTDSDMSDTNLTVILTGELD
ncbi:LytR C-terminal domain-containing protein [Nocardioides daeguensis]|uniref:LytR/CpsA/Psr regulator C-terminal domain-containing protein n=1 Tax=Nocardioides daeguensis TaxID=908359 RepID=A0ABP6W6J0_9ACTN|nr:LytR C-terminal domain-containing protein [Nocardioides daeguensis]MBV6727816.1 LytR C-terminal domain-containing protein [Nocardioides daeguensis]MCR1775287.1 LytR C-terminal domain-containing protein [Nocardioides daeguensis]